MAARHENGLEADYESAARSARRSLAAEFELEEVNTGLLPRRARRGWRHAWQLKVVVASRAIDVLVGIPYCFPDVFPSVFLKEDDRPEYHVPHLEADGLICAIDTTATFPNPDLPGEVAVSYVRDAIRVVENGIARVDRDSEYRAEFTHYWPQGGNKDDLSILRDYRSSRKVARYELTEPWGPYGAVVAESVEEAREWLARVGANSKGLETRAWLLPLRSLGSAPFPRTNAELLRRLQSEDPKAAKRLLSTLKDPVRSAHIVLSVETPTGAMLAGWTHRVSAPPRTSYSKRSQKYEIPGFRPGHHPSELELLGYGASTPIDRRRVVRADRDRLVKRTIGSRTEARATSFTMIGCGAVGSLLSEALMRSGRITSATLIDPGLLDIENVMRHLCPMTMVGRFKSEAAKVCLERHYPFAAVRYSYEDALDLLRAGEASFEADLTVVAVGNTVVERRLCRELWKALPAGRRIVFVWVEPFMAAGHALSMCAGFPGCFECRLGSDLGYSGSVLDATEESLLREPGCSPSFTPYGGTDLLSFVQEAARFILKPDDSPQELVWLGDLESARLSATLVEPWRESASYRSVVRASAAKSRCKTCGAH